MAVPLELVVFDCCRGESVAVAELFASPSDDEAEDADESDVDEPSVDEVEEF